MATFLLTFPPLNTPKKPIFQIDITGSDTGLRTCKFNVPCLALMFLNLQPNLYY